MHKTKKYIYVFSCIFLMTLILSGCADTPDEVKQEITEIEKAKEEQRELKKSLTYVHASELQKDRRDNFSMNHGVLCFEGSVNIPDCENVYLLEMKVNDEIFKKIEKNMLLVMDQVGVDEKEWTKYIIAENGIDEKGGAATDKSYAERGYCSVEVDDFIITADQAGYLSINQVMENEDHTYFLKNGKILRNYYFVNDEKKECNDKVDLPDKTVILETLKDMFEKKVELVNSCSPNLNLVVHDARICENTETKNKMVVFRALGSYKGVCFDPDYILSQEAKLMNGRSFVGFEMNQQIHEEEDACAIALRETSYIVSQEKKEIDKIIDFDSALRMIEHTVPQDKITTIESAEFMYQIYYEGEEGQRWENICENPPKFYACPVWRFVEKDRLDEYSATVYYVDAVSGEVYSFYKGCTP